MIATRPGRRSAMTVATLVARVVVPAPPFGLKTATRVRGRLTVVSAGHQRSEVARRGEADGQRLDPGLELAGVERLGDHVVGAGFQEADPLLDVVGLADAQDRDRGQGEPGAQVPADVGGRSSRDRSRR